MLLAYDGSPAADEALFVAAHLGKHWRRPLVVLTVGQAQGGPNAIANGREYLTRRGVAADFIQKSGSPAQAILDAAQEHGCGLIVMGSYGSWPLLEIAWGSTVNQVLLASRWPLLICR